MTQLPNPLPVPLHALAMAYAPLHRLNPSVPSIAAELSETHGADFTVLDAEARRIAETVGERA